MKFFESLMLIAFFCVGVQSLEAKTLRVTEMTPADWSQLTQRRLNDIVIEFRQGDEFPVSFKAEGDFLQSTTAGTSYVEVRKNFWLKINQNKILMSLDGVNFKELNELISGGLEAGSDLNGGVVNGINVLLKAYIK